MASKCLCCCGTEEDSDSSSSSLSAFLEQALERRSRNFQRPVPRRRDTFESLEKFYQKRSELISSNQERPESKATETPEKAPKKSSPTQEVRLVPRSPTTGKRAENRVVFCTGFGEEPTCKIELPGNASVASAEAQGGANVVSKK